MSPKGVKNLDVETQQEKIPYAQVFNVVKLKLGGRSSLYQDQWYHLYRL